MRAGLLGLLIGAITLVGCGSESGSGVRLDPNVKPPKAPSEMTREERIAQIQRLPMPEAEKQKQIAALGAAK